MAAASPDPPPCTMARVIPACSVNSMAGSSPSENPSARSRRMRNRTANCVVSSSSVLTFRTFDDGDASTRYAYFDLFSGSNSMR